MSKTITDNQQIGELGEAATRAQFLRIGFQFDVRSRLEAGIDAIAEVMIDGQPTAKMIAVQVKSTRSGKYTGETEEGFTYRLKPDDLAYWRGSNLPVIIVLFRQSDDSFYWKDVKAGTGESELRLTFDKREDRLDRSTIDRLASLTVPKQGHGYYVPPLGGGESAIVNILPVSFPEEMFVAMTPYSGQRAIAILLDTDRPGKRFDWTIQESTLWSFHDPRDEITCEIVDCDQVEAIETALFADHEDIAVQNNFSHLLRKALGHQFQRDLGWDRDRRLFYFRPLSEAISRTFAYRSAKNPTSSEVVKVYRQKESGATSYVRHHAFVPRFERLGDQWYLIISPTYYFTTNGYTPHSHPHALLAGKKRVDNNASLRGQVIMWHRFLARQQPLQQAESLFASDVEAGALGFAEPPSVALSTSVPEDAWRAAKGTTTDETQGSFALDGV